MMVVASSQANTITMLEKPRIISEVKKTKKKPPPSNNHNNNNGSLLDGKPRISGELDCALGLQCWQPRYVEVRDGNLLVWSTSRDQPELKLPLRRLNLQPGVKPRTFSLSRDHEAPLANFQAGSDRDYERWVKTLAVELMRHTPLEAVRFLDILGITATLSPPVSTPSRRRSEQITGAVRRGLSEDSALRVVGGRHHAGSTDLGGRHRSGAARAMARKIMSESDTDHEDQDQELAALLIRCQQGDNFVSVREKRLLFEALCRQGRRLTHSTDNLCVGDGRGRRPKRARSLHDLSRCSSVAVREICRYFEQCGQQESESRPPPTAEERGTPPPHISNAYLSRRRLQRGERRLARLKQLAADSEEAIWRLQEEMAAIDAERDTRKGSTQRSKGLYTALERRLSEEEARLGRLQDEAARVLKEIELATSRFETALMQSTELLDKSQD